MAVSRSVVFNLNIIWKTYTFTLFIFTWILPLSISAPSVSTPFAGLGFDIGLSVVEVGETWEGAARIEFVADIVLAGGIPDYTIVANYLLQISSNNECDVL